MITENLSTLKIHKLTQEQYNRELAAGNLDETALYLTPDAEINPISKGGTNATTEEGARENLGMTTAYNACSGYDTAKGTIEERLTTLDKVLLIVSFDSTTGELVTKSADYFAFTLGGVSYQFDKGMTWEAWVNSSYNTAEIYISPSSNAPVVVTGFIYTDETLGTYVLSTDFIEEQVYYIPNTGAI